MGCWRRIIGRYVPRREGWVFSTFTSPSFLLPLVLHNPSFPSQSRGYSQFSIDGEDWIEGILIYHHHDSYSSLSILKALILFPTTSTPSRFGINKSRTPANDPDRSRRIRNQSQSRGNFDWINPLGFKSSKNVDWWYSPVSPFSSLLHPLFFLSPISLSLFFLLKQLQPSVHITLEITIRFRVEIRGVDRNQADT